MLQHNGEMRRFIERVHQEPFFLTGCFRKSIKIAKKARELGKEADLVLCWSVVSHRELGGFRTVQPHMYAEIEGQKVDVAFDPRSEKRHCKNSEQIILLPLRLPRLPQIRERI